MMDYRPNGNTSLEEQRRKDQMIDMLSGNAPQQVDNTMGALQQQMQTGHPGSQQHFTPTSDLGRINLAGLEARMAAQGALAARVQAVQQAQAQQNIQMMHQQSPGMPPKPRVVYHPNSPMKTAPMQFSPQKQTVTGGYHSPVKQRLPPYRSSSEFSFPSPASSFLSPTEHSGYPSPASFASSIGFPNSAGSFNSATGNVRNPAEGLSMLRAASMGMRGERPDGLPTMLAPPLTGQLPPSAPVTSPLSNPPSRHTSNSSMDDMSVSTMQTVEGKLFIDEVREWDVLCGRGGKSNHHSGNKRYRHVVSEMKMMYRKTEAKAIKTDLSRAIVEHVCNYGGRFIKKDDNTGRYYVLTKAEARKKTSQALRETKELKWTA